MLAQKGILDKVSINKALLLSALTINAQDKTSVAWTDNENTTNNDIWSFASDSYDNAFNLEDISVGYSPRLWKI